MKHGLHYGSSDASQAHRRGPGDADSSWQSSGGKAERILAFHRSELITCFDSLKLVSGVADFCVGYEHGRQTLTLTMSSRVGCVLGSGVRAHGPGVCSDIGVSALLGVGSVACGCV